MVQHGLHLSQDLSLRQEQIIAPHQIQSLEILAIPLLDLQARVNQEMEDNPTLELMDSESEQLIGDPMEELSDPQSDNRELAGDVAEKDEYLANLMQIDDMWREYVPPNHAKQYATADDEEKRRYFFDSLTTEKTLADDLLEQLRLSDTDDETAMLAEQIIGSLDEAGYLRATLEELATSMAADTAAVKKALDLVQTFEPPGIGARDLRECLLIQLRHNGRENSLTYKVVDKHLEDIARNRIPQMAKALKTSPPALYEVIEEIKRLQPRPGSASENNHVQYVLPELEVELDEEQNNYVVKSQRDYLPRLRISPHYLRILEDPSVPKEVKQYVREKITGGNFLIKSIAQRQSTLQTITQIIVARQRAFLEEGEEALHPLTMSQVADEIGVHETTVSRAIANKFVQTPRGLYPLKFFFAGGYETEDGEMLSSHSIKHKLQTLITEENPNKPLSDQKLVNLLKQDGLNVARRTVAKYREELGIPSSHLRKNHSS